MAEIVRRRSWGGVLPLGRHVSISGSSFIQCASASIAPPHPGGAKCYPGAEVQGRTGPSITAGLCALFCLWWWRRGAMSSRSKAEHWAQELEAVAGRIAPQFGRAEPRRRALTYLQGLLAPLERKNGWHLAEAAGDCSPHGLA